MWAKLSRLILRLFSASALGTVIAKLLSATGSTIVLSILDSENQKKAYEFVKELRNRDDLTGLQKATEFNKKFIAWGHTLDREISESVVNCLRELALNALKSEQESELPTR